MSTAGNTAQTTRCPECSTGIRRINIRLVPAPFRHHSRYGLPYNGTLMRLWVCDTCPHAEDAGTQWLVRKPVREDIVAAIRRLKASGWKFFDWEK